MGRAEGMVTGIDVTLTTADGRTGHALIDLPARATPPSMRVGISVKPDEYGQWFPLFPGAAYSRVFTPPAKGLYPRTLSATAALPPGVMPHRSFKDFPGAAFLVREFDRIPAGKTEAFTYWHEPQGKGQPDLDDYVRGWREFRRIADDHPNRDRITLVMVHTVWPLRFAGVDWRPWLERTLDLADAQGWDAYEPDLISGYEPPESGCLAIPLLARAEYGCRTWICELGSALSEKDPSGSGRAAWFRQAADLASRHGVEQLGLWCSTSGDGKWDYRPHDAATQLAWKAIIQKYNNR